MSTVNQIESNLDLNNESATAARTSVGHCDGVENLRSGAGIRTINFDVRQIALGLTFVDAADKSE